MVFLLPAENVLAQPGKPAGPGLVVTSRVYEGDFADLQSFVGSVEAVRQVTIGSAVEGRVQSVGIEQGMAVVGPSPKSQTPGDVLLQIETDTLDIEIESAKIQFVLAEKAFDELKITLPNEIELAKAKLAESEARARFSNDEFTRLNRLATQANAVSTAELEQARSQYQADQQLATQAEVELQRLTSTREIRLEQAERRVAAMKQVMVRLEDQRTKHTIRAPFSGFVVNKLTDVGAWVNRGAAVAEIVALDEVDFTFNVPQELVGKVQRTLDSDKESEVLITFDGFEEPVVARLTVISPQVDVRSRLVKVRARLTNPVVGGVPILKPGMLGRANLAVGELRHMLVVPRDALVLGGGQTVVYKVLDRNNERTVVPILVQLGVSSGNWIEVKGQIEDGDQVVVEGNERLKANDKVKIDSQRTEQPPFAAKK
ncbi:MAG: efflux RND transporter periplasmic adaptor subunit [Pirellulaceae bacterium]